MDIQVTLNGFLQLGYHVDIAAFHRDHPQWRSTPDTTTLVLVNEPCYVGVSAGGLVSLGSRSEADMRREADAFADAWLRYRRHSEGDTAAAQPLVTTCAIAKFEMGRPVDVEAFFGDHPDWTRCAESVVERTAMGEGVSAIRVSGIGTITLWACDADTAIREALAFKQRLGRYCVSSEGML